jgi:hypothetical protein
VVRFGPVRRQLEGGEKGAEKQPRAEFARYQVGVLALPAEAGSGFSMTAAVSTKTLASPPAWAMSQRASAFSRFLITS